MANGGELEIGEGDVGESKIVEHRAHLVDNLNGADDIGLAHLFGDGAHRSQDLRVVDLRGCLSAPRCAEQTLGQILEH